MAFEVRDGKLYIPIPGALITIRGEPDKQVPDTEVNGPTFLKWKYTRQIDSLSQKDTATGTTRDRAVMFDTLVKAFAEESGPGSRVPNHQGVPIPFAPDAVEDHAHTEAISLLAYELAIFFGYLVVDFPDTDVPSAEGNDEAEKVPSEGGSEIA